MKKKATVVMTRHSSPVAWRGVWLAALVLTARLSAGAPAELPPPRPAAASQADATALSPALPTVDTEAKPDGGAPDAEKQKKPDPADGRCDHCDGCSCVRRVCVAKHTEKTVTKVCWSYKCEDFCIPGPSVYCGEKCLHDECGHWTHSLWKPTCAEVRTKRVPVKNEVKRKVPSVEWKLEERCNRCRFLCFGHSTTTTSRQNSEDAETTPANAGGLK